MTAPLHPRGTLRARFEGASSDPVLCPGGDQAAVGSFPTQCAISVGTVQSTNAKLKPETSKSYTLGIILEPVKDLSATLDFYSIEIDHQIVAVANCEQAAVHGESVFGQSDAGLIGEFDDEVFPVLDRAGVSHSRLQTARMPRR